MHVNIHEPYKYAGNFKFIPRPVILKKIWTCHHGLEIRGFQFALFRILGWVRRF